MQNNLTDLQLNITRTLRKLRATEEDESLENIINIDLPNIIILLKQITGKDIVHLNKLQKKKLSRQDVIKVLVYLSELSEKHILDSEYIEIFNSPVYKNLINILATKNFNNSGNWPNTEVETDNDNFHALAEIKPDPELIEPFLDMNEITAWKNKVSNYLMEMDDITADVMDIASNLWLRKSTSPDSMVMVNADEILQARGILPVKNSVGVYSGYKKEIKDNISQHINILQNTFLTITEFEVLEASIDNKDKKAKWRGVSPALVVDFKIQKREDDSYNTYVWNLKPGAIFSNYLFGNGRQKAIQSQKALKYDPYKQVYEKRLTRKFSWNWDITKYKLQHIYTVESLLNSIKKPIQSSKPSLTKNRLEKALDQLQIDNVIKSWQYINIAESEFEKKNWITYWLTLKIIIIPPDNYIEEYKRNEKLIGAFKQLDKLPSKDSAINLTLKANGDAFKKERINQALKIFELAPIIGVSTSTISRFESGKKVSDDSIEKMNKWLNKLY